MKKRGKAKSKGRSQRNNSLARSAASTTNHLNVPKRGSIAYSADDGRAIALLLLPFLVIAMFLGINHTMRPVGGFNEPVRNRSTASAAINSLNAAIARIPLAVPTLPPEALRPPAWALAPHGKIELPSIELPTQPPQIALAPELLPAMTALSIPPPPFTLPSTAPHIEISDIASIPKSTEAEAGPKTVALVLPPRPFTLPSTVPDFVVPSQGPTSEVCLPLLKPSSVASSVSPSDFGMKLAAAARAQITDFVIYSASYKRISYPMGDIPSLYGSCSDVVIRAYRSLGIDLQELVQRARVGSGDPNIDHRRTETLRAFFGRHGEIVPNSTFPEDYKPGDIVTYYRPFSRVSRAHIAVVAGELGPSGRPMIVHNRGWGPQLEDALFVDRITGHYRFSATVKLAAAPAFSSRAAQQSLQRPPFGSAVNRINMSSRKSRSAHFATTVQ